jgi:2-dehydropantoate 2-reductase
VNIEHPVQLLPILCNTNKMMRMLLVVTIVTASAISSSAFSVGYDSLSFILPMKRVTASTSVPCRSLLHARSGGDDDDDGRGRPIITTTTTKAVVAVIGSGAVGGYYGSRLWECDCYDVHFQMRGEHLETSLRVGFNVTSIDGDVFIPPDQLQTFTDPNELKDKNVDWVIVALKSFSLDEIPELIYPLLQPGKTRVLCIMNGLIEEDLIRSLKQYASRQQSGTEAQSEELAADDMNGSTMGRETISCCGAVFGGMALICSNRLGPGRIDHSYAGLLSSGVAARSSDLSDDDLQRDFEELFRPTCVPIAYESSVLAGRWRKCLWNVPFNGISVSMGGLTVDKIVNDPGLRQLAYHLMDEVIEAANADLKFHGLGSEYFVGEEDKEKMMHLSDTMGAYKTSTMLDFVNGRPMETKFLFRIPMERAQHLGVPVPKLETIVAMCEALEKLRPAKAVGVDLVELAESRQEEASAVVG